MLIPKVEKFIGIETYVTRSPGIGGVIKQSVEDFVVEEVLVDGSKAQVDHQFARGVLGSSQTKQRYLLCVLVKRDWDTFRAIRAVAEQLNINTAQIHIAGIKDAKALTAQHIAIEGVTEEDIEEVKVKDLEVRLIGYFRSKLSSYYLRGNSFQVTIRGIRFAKSTIQERISRTVEELRAHGGLPNFFGHQRFGTTRPITHLVGKAIVKGDFRKAAMLFLTKTSPYEHPESQRAREELRDTRDIKKALGVFPKTLHYEGLMLKHLVSRQDDFVGAFKRLPMKLRLLFPQAYQSYLFNRFLSGRIREELPLNEAGVGDYVVSLERSGIPNVMMSRKVNAENLEEINVAIEKGKMRLALPLIGFKRGTSHGVQGEIEKKVMSAEGIAPEEFQVKDMPEVAARGELRTALVPLNDFRLDEISQDSANPSKRLARMRFTLRRGSYATVLLRELMKARDPIRAGF